MLVLPCTCLREVHAASLLGESRGGGVGKGSLTCGFHLIKVPGYMMRTSHLLSTCYVPGGVESTSQGCDESGTLTPHTVCQD